MEIAQRPECTNKILFQAWSEASAQRYWEQGLWRLKPNPLHHDFSTIRRRIWYWSLLTEGATDFFTAHPSTGTTLPAKEWSLMLRRHLDVAVYDDSDAHTVGVSWMHKETMLQVHAEKDLGLLTVTEQ